MTENDYIAKRRAATKRLNAEIRAMPEFAAAVVETEAYIYAEGELSLEATCSKMKRVQINGVPEVNGAAKRVL